MIFYILYKIGFILANILPLRFAYWLAERFADVQCTLAKKDREAVTQNLSVVLKKDAKECRKLARRVFRNFGLYLVDFFRMRRLDMRFVKKQVDVIGLEIIDNLLAQQRGVIAVTCHIGNWEMGGVIMAILGYKISAVALNHTHAGINKFFIRQREGQGLKVIRMGSLMKACISSLLKGEILALVGDRDFMNSGTVLKFFEIPTSIPKGPALLSLKTNSPIVPGFFVRSGRYDYKLIFERPIWVQRGSGMSNEEAIRKLTEDLIRVMEGYIGRYPDQWLLFRKFWEMPVDMFVL